eukprot:747321-Hanusia_phi.AAC.1
MRLAGNLREARSFNCTAAWEQLCVHKPVRGFAPRACAGAPDMLSAQSIPILNRLIPCRKYYTDITPPRCRLPLRLSDPILRTESHKLLGAKTMLWREIM